MNVFTRETLSHVQAAHQYGADHRIDAKAAAHTGMLPR